MPLTLRTYKNMLAAAGILFFAACSSGDGSAQTDSDNKPLKIVPLGDSITEGVPFTYRYALHGALKDAGMLFDFVGSMSNANHYGDEWDSDNEGHAGWTTHDILDHLDGWLKAYTPDVALIHLGTNDVVAIAYSAVYEGNFSIQSSSKALESIIAKLRTANSGVEIYLAQILPIIEDDPGSAVHGTLKIWNQTLATMAAALSTPASPIIIVDMNSEFSAADLHDNVHPNEEGATKMANKWAEKILGRLR